MARFKRHRFNPWDNLHKMLDQNKKAQVTEEEQLAFKSEVNIPLTFYY